MDSVQTLTTTSTENRVWLDYKSQGCFPVMAKTISSVVFSMEISNLVAAARVLAPNFFS